MSEDKVISFGNKQVEITNRTEKGKSADQGLFYPPAAG